MRRSHNTNSLVIISDHTKGYYVDEWDKESKVNMENDNKSDLRVIHRPLCLC